jgi:hypothetical protein
VSVLRCAVAVAATILLAACTSESSGTTSTTTSAPTTTLTTTTTTATPTTTLTPTTTAAPTTTTLPPTTAPVVLPDFPALKERLSHGGEAWAVYFAVGEYEDPGLAATTAVLADLGFPSGVGDLGCDLGAAELLGVDSSLAGVALYFDTEADAAAFVDAYEARGYEALGWGLVNTYCLD